MRKVYEINAGQHAGSHLIIRPDGTATVVRTLRASELAAIVACGDIIDVTPGVGVSAAAPRARTVSKLDTRTRARALGLVVHTPEA